MNVLTFTLLLFCHLISHWQLDHLHAEYVPECLLRPLEHSLKCSTLVAQDYISRQITRISLSHHMTWEGAPFSLMPSLRIAALLKSQASAYRTSFLISWPSTDSTCSLSSSSSSSSSASLSCSARRWRCLGLCSSSSSSTTWYRISPSVRGDSVGGWDLLGAVFVLLVAFR